MGENVINIAETFLENFIRFSFGIICHQDENILFKINQVYFPLCPRCTGLHLGFFIILLIAYKFDMKHIKLKSQLHLMVVLLLTSVAGIHWLTGILGVIKQDVTSRFFTGIVSGMAFNILIISTGILEKIQLFTKKLLPGIFKILLLLIIIYTLTAAYLLLMIPAFIIVLFNAILILSIVSLLLYQLINKKYLLINAKGI